MAKWHNLYNPIGTYQSQVIDVSSDFDFYTVTSNLNFQKNDGDVDVQIRASFDSGLSWTNWKSIINSNTYIDIFDGEGSKLKYTKFQYRVVFSIGTTFGVPPIFNSLSLIFSGGYKVENTGDIENLPEMWIKKINGSGDVLITNETTGQNIQLNGLNNDETVYIDNLNKDITTDLPLTYRYKNHNKEWLVLVEGTNILTGIGDFELTLKHEFQTLQG